MSEWEDRINSLLNDPAQMDKIANLAKTLMGGENAAGQGGGPSAGAGSGPADGDALGFDPAVLRRLSRLMQDGGGRDGRDKRALLEAMKPYLSEKRRVKMDKAIRMARLARMAQLAIGELGENGDV